MMLPVNFRAKNLHSMLIKQIKCLSWLYIAETNGNGINWCWYEFTEY